MSSQGEPSASEAAPSRRFAFLELLALTGIAFAQPTYDLLARNPMVLVLQRTSRVELVVITLIIMLVPPTVLWLVELAVGLIGDRVREIVHDGLLLLLAAVIVVEVMKPKTGLGPAALMALGAASGAIFVILVVRITALRSWLRVLAVAPVIFALLFLGASHANAVVFGADRAASGVAIRRPHRIVMVVMDELPLASIVEGNGSGKIDADLFPNFARLANASTWFRNESTVAPFTEAAVPAILTGDYPKNATTPPIVADYPHNLFTALGATYSINAYEHVTRLCPINLCESRSADGRRPLEKRVATVLQFGTDLWRSFASPNRAKKAIEFGSIRRYDANPVLSGAKFVRSLQPTTHPQLDFLHVLLPHQPWRFLPTGQRTSLPTQHQELGDLQATFNFDPKRGPAFWEWRSPGAALAGRQRHLLQLQAGDKLLGAILDRLHTIEAYDDAMIVVTADHGVAYTSQEPVRDLSKKNASEIAWTPLFVKLPGQSKGKIDDRHAISLDILPTVADVIGAKLPWATDGKSLLGQARPEGPRRVLDWNRATLRPSAGSKYASVDGAKGFAEALAGKPWPAKGPLRLYGVGPYGDLVGKSASTFVDTSEAAPIGHLATPEVFANVVRDAPIVPWANASGTIDATPDGVPIAVAVNGTVAGLSETFRTIFGPGTWTARLAPPLLHDGANQITLYLIRGDPESPRLVPVNIG